jgi:hypothetical protein
MIRIEYQEPQTADWKRWREDCERATQALYAAVQAGEKPQFDQRLYSRLKRDHYFAAEGPFGGRCAYCESPISGTQPGDLDHFRPKSEVTHADDSTVRLTDPSTGEERPHPGYYWLAYHWRNLVPSCIGCNRPNNLRNRKHRAELKLGKRSRFPVEGQHALDASELRGERPLLINPAEEDPAPHLEVDTTTGLLKARTARGAMCVAVFGLNVRKLPEMRLAVMDQVRAVLVELILSKTPSDQQSAKAKLAALLQGSQGHVATARARYRELHALLTT